MPSRIRIEGGKKRNVPEGLWSKCSACTAVLYRPELERLLNVCPKCNHHMPLTARKRLDHFLDRDNRVELNAGLESVDVLKFKDSKKYRDRISTAQKKTGEMDALIVIEGQLHTKPLVACAFEFEFMGGSEYNGILTIARTDSFVLS